MAEPMIPFVYTRQGKKINKDVFLAFLKICLAAAGPKLGLSG